jgi:DNA-directed RNA polymerase sigma subunit (sigma70/sigma32)
MKISKEKLIKIIQEELDNMSEAELTRKDLEPEVSKILSKLSPEEQAIIRQFMSLQK